MKKSQSEAGVNLRLDFAQGRNSTSNLVGGTCVREERPILLEIVKP